MRVTLIYPNTEMQPSKAHDKGNHTAFRGKQVVNQDALGHRVSAHQVAHLDRPPLFFMEEVYQAEDEGKRMGYQGTKSVNQDAF